MAELLEHIINARPEEKVAAPVGADFGRVLIKLSGEALQGEQGYGVDPSVLEQLAGEVKAVHDLGVQTAVVIGGGNIFRGMKGSTQGMDRASADYMGMLATVMNALALQDAIERIGIPTRVLSAISMEEVCETYVRRRAMRHLEKRRVVIFAAGTGNPYFTTDTAASLRAMEIQADLIIKATKVDGVYDKDPMQHQDAIKYDQISYIDVLSKGLKVMDATAISLCMDNKMPLCVLNGTEEGSIVRVVRGEKIGTMIRF